MHTAPMDVVAFFLEAGGFLLTACGAPNSLHLKIAATPSRVA